MAISFPRGLPEGIIVSSNSFDHLLELIALNAQAVLYRGEYVDHYKYELALAGWSDERQRMETYTMSELTGLAWQRASSATRRQR
jgi:hypothetical protein